MKAKLLILLAIPFLFYACKKDTYTTKPQISIKSINNKNLSPGDILLFQIEFTDAEGDVQDTIWIQKLSKTCPTTPGVQILNNPNRIPDFTPIRNIKGIFEIGYAYNVNNTGYEVIRGCGTKNDTAYFRFWLKDKANNVSDTLTTENIVLLR